MVTVNFKRLPNGENLPLPRYQSDGAAGMDIVAASDVAIYDGKVAIVETGFACEIPEGYELQVRSRSGLAAKEGVFVANSPGTIDSDYRGEIKVILTMAKRGFLQIKRGDRIAQLVLAPVTRADVAEVEELGTTVRGVGGLGSTGLR